MPQTRFLFISDSHEGGASDHACLHPRYTGEHWEQLWVRLGQWVTRNQIDFIIHGGDITDNGRKREIITAADRITRNIPVPFYLCLGNHDLACQASIQYWRENHNGMLPQSQTDYHWHHGQTAFYVMCPHWHDAHDFFWEWGDGQRPTPRFSPQQLQQFESFLQQDSRPVILTAHAPVEAVETSQTGLAEPWHTPHQPYRDAIYGLARKYPRLKLILSGHNHAQNQAQYDTWASCNNAAFNESPAQARLITIDDDAIHVTTLMMAKELQLPMPLNGYHLWGIQAGPAHDIRIPLA